MAMSLRNALFIALLTVVIGFVALNGMPQNSFFVGDEGVKFIQIENLATNGLAGIELPYPGIGLDADYHFFPIIPPYALVIDKHAFSQWPLLYPFLVSLLYKLFGFHGLYIMSVLATGFSLAALAVIGRELGIRVRLATLFLVLTATPMLVYSILLWEHALALAFILWSFALSLQSLRTGRMWGATVSGLLLALAIWTRNESALFIPALLFAFWRYKIGPAEKRALSGMAIGVAMMIIFMAVTQKLTVGEWLGLDVSQFAKRGVATEISGFTGSLWGMIVYKIKLAAVLAVYRFPSELWIILGVAWLIFIAAIWKAERWWAWPAMAMAVFMSLGIGVWSLIVDPMQAGFLINPVIAISGILAYRTRENNARRIRFLLDCVVVFAILGLVLAPATGGVQWGVRFLLPATVVLSFFGLTIFIDKVKVRLPQPLLSMLAGWFILAVALSVIWQAVGLLTVKQDRERDADLLLRTSGRSEEAIVTDTFWLPQELGAIFSIRNIYYVTTIEDYEDLLKSMTLNNVRNFAFISAKPDSPLAGGHELLDVVRSEVKEEIILPSGFYLQSMRVIPEGEI